MEFITHACPPVPYYVQCLIPSSAILNEREQNGSVGRPARLASESVAGRWQAGLPARAVSATLCLPAMP